MLELEEVGGSGLSSSSSSSSDGEDDYGSAAEHPSERARVQRHMRGLLRSLASTARS
jgi:hypothetical protein